MSEAIERYLALWEKWAETGHDQTLKTEDLQCEMDKAWYAMTTEEIDSVNKEIDTSYGTSLSERKKNNGE